MLYFLLGVIVPALCILVFAYVWSENKQKKAKEKLKKEMFRRIKHIQTEFKACLNELTQAKVMRFRHKDSIYAIVNNFFVFQAVTPENVTKLEGIAEGIIEILKLQAAQALSDEEKFELKERIFDFSAKLPGTGRGFGAEFYDHKLPALLELLGKPVYEEPEAETESDLDEVLEISESDNNQPEHQDGEVKSEGFYEQQSR